MLIIKSDGTPETTLVKLNGIKLLGVQSVKFKITKNEINMVDLKIIPLDKVDFTNGEKETHYKLELNVDASKVESSVYLNGEIFAGVLELKFVCDMKKTKCNMKYYSIKKNKFLRKKIF